MIHFFPSIVLSSLNLCIHSKFSKLYQFPEIVMILTENEDIVGTHSNDTVIATVFTCFLYDRHQHNFSFSFMHEIEKPNRTNNNAHDCYYFTARIHICYPALA